MGCGQGKTNKVIQPTHVAHQTEAKPQSLQAPGSNIKRPSFRPGHFILSKTTPVENDYRILDKLGSGAFAQVFKAQHIATGQIRAIKRVYKKGLHPSQITSNNVLREVILLKELDHPNIIRMHEVYEEKASFYLVTEICEGGELFDVITQLKNFNESQAAEIMYQLLSAMAYCHERTITHRDLKPENVLLEQNPQSGNLNVRIADFGSSCILDARRRAQGVFGSAYYLAPEVFIGNYNEKCDIWSIGIIMYILLTGRAPYRGSNEQDIIYKVKNQPFRVDRQSLRNLSDQAIDLMESLVILDPRERITANVALIHPWIQQNRFRTHSTSLNSSLNNMRQFVSSYKLKEAVLTFITIQMMNREDLLNLKESFKQMDKNGDGKLSSEELLITFQEGMGRKEASQQVNKIMKEVDTDGSGFIDYTEFLNACNNWERYLSIQNLQQAFQVFDKDQSGKISAEELRTTFGSDFIHEEVAWEQIIKEVDENGDGEIDLTEFLNMMNRKFR